MESTSEDGGWPLRPAMLAAIGVVAAVVLQQLLDQNYIPGRIVPPPSAVRVAMAALVATAALSFGYVAERSRLVWAVSFAGLVGVVAGSVFWWNNGPSGEFLWDWRSAALFLAIAIAAPLFQTARDEGAWRFPYADVHGHAWTNVVLWFASWGFTGIVFAMAFLLSELFQLIGIHALRDLLREGWFTAALGGGALGGALGLFRERDRILRLLQRVVTAVLSVLAPVLGVALLLFLLSLPFTGLGALWEATKATTPILLSCVVGALILANAVIGNGAEEEAANPVLRYGAMALAAAMLPFAVIAAVATGLRVQQYGFTPDRLWALTVVVIACAYGLAYLVALVRGRMGWAAQARPANLRLGFALAGLALFLALPIVSFNAISTSDQVARLESGKVAPEKFDWAALAFDFGEPGKAALRRLQPSSNLAIRAKAMEAAKAKSRYEIAENPAFVDVAAASRRIRALPDGAVLPSGLIEYVARGERCGQDKDRGCTVYMLPGEREALLLADVCFGKPPSGVSIYCHGPTQIWLVDGKWSGSPKEPTRLSDAVRIAEGEAYKAGAIEVRPVERRQVFVGGKPVGEPFE